MLPNSCLLDKHQWTAMQQTLKEGEDRTITHSTEHFHTMFCILYLKCSYREQASCEITDVRLSPHIHCFNSDDLAELGSQIQDKRPPSLLNACLEQTWFCWCLADLCFLPVPHLQFPKARSTAVWLAFPNQMLLTS